MNLAYKINSIIKSYKYFFNINLEYDEEENKSSELSDQIDLTNWINLKKLSDSNILDKKEYVCEINYYSFIPLGFSLFFIKPIDLIDNIYVGNIFNASDWSVISNLNISHIICFNKKIENFYPNEKKLKFIIANLESNLENLEEILDLINQIQTKIDSKSNKSNNILLFSLAGNNTPCIIMIAYLVFKYNFEFKKALIYVCKKIPNYNLNKKYIEILKLQYN